MVGGQNRQFLTRWPTNYDNKKAYPLHIGLHGANGNISENGRDNFGLWSLAKDSTIFVTLAAMGGAVVRQFGFGLRRCRAEASRERAVHRHFEGRVAGV